MSKEGEVVRFWSLQRLSWRELWRSIQSRWSRRARVGFVICVSAITTTAVLVSPLAIDWVHKDDVSIETHKDGQAIPRCVATFGGKGKPKDGHHLWIAVEFLDENQVKRIQFSKEAETDDGTWYVNKVDVGGREQAMSPYTVTIVDVDQATNSMLNTVKVDMSDSSKPTMPEGKDRWRLSYRKYPTGALPVDRVRVTRLEGNDLNCNSLVKKSRKQS